MNIKPLVFIDLDDTIFQTPRKRPVAPDSRPVTFDECGNPGSWMTARQHAFFQWLSENATLVPVTGRSKKQLERVCLAFDSWRIVSHGALLLEPSGKANAEWERHVANIIRPLDGDMDFLCGLCTSFYAARGINAHARIIMENGLKTYIVIKHKDASRYGEISAVTGLLMKQTVISSFYITANDNNFSIIPRGVDKGAAVQKLLDYIQNPDMPLLGFGDGLSDLSFMNLCDWWGTPCDSQITRHVMGNCQ